MAVLWIPIMGIGAVVVSLSEGLPFSILFPIGWLFGTYIILEKVIICSKVVEIHESCLSVKLFKKKNIIPFDNIKTVYGGLTKYPMAGSRNNYVSIVIEDRSLNGCKIDFLPKRDGYQKNQEHKVVDELKYLIRKHTTDIS